MEIVLIFLLLLIFVILIRTICFRPLKININKSIDNKQSKEEVDLNSAYKSLSEALKHKTISHYNNNGTDYKQFDDFINSLKENYPNVFNKCQFEQADDYGILFKLPGISSSKPSVLMAHYDVVAADGKWDFDPFGGEIKDGYILGRGALDTKSTVCASLEALNELLKSDYKPLNDLYLCFGADEEVYGSTCEKRVAMFDKLNIKPDFVLDEGGAIVSKIFPGVNKDTAVVGVTEKGLLNVVLKVKTKGGHSSTPTKNDSIIMLSKAILKLEKKQMKAKLSLPVLEMFNRLGRNASFGMRVLFANQWLFKGILKIALKKLGGEAAALVRTTFAFTMLEGSNSYNVLPQEAKATINIRIAPFDTTDSVIRHIKKVCGKNIEVEVINGFEASKISPINNKQFKDIEETIIETFGSNVIVCPYIMLGATDSRHFTKISSNVYRFSPMFLSKEERSSIHGVNEKISIDNYNKCIMFYIRLLNKL